MKTLLHPRLITIVLALSCSPFAMGCCGNSESVEALFDILVVGALVVVVLTAVAFVALGAIVVWGVVFGATKIAQACASEPSYEHEPRSRAWRRR